VAASAHARAKALWHLKKQDPKLGRVIDEVGPSPMRFDALHSPFAALAEAIMHQQITGKAAASIVRRFREALGESGESGAFPTPEAVLAASETTLRKVGLSGSKARALKDLAAKTLDGTVPTLDDLHAMDEALIVERLTQVRGIGLWTVHMLLIFRLGRPDVLPSTDYGIRKGFMRVFRKRTMPAPRDVERHAEKWRPYRSVASWYLWRALELPVARPRARRHSGGP
jgi:3-methyladenine DNA glycosylase/8-oxoguanine DNA glycosylase